MDYTDFTLPELQQFAWDYYKDVHGFRPRHLDMGTREDCIAIIDLLNDRMDALRATPEGRAQLADEGWI